MSMMRAMSSAEFTVHGTTLSLERVRLGHGGGVQLAEVRGPGAASGRRRETGHRPAVGSRIEAGEPGRGPAAIALVACPPASSRRSGRRSRSRAPACLHRQQRAPVEGLDGGAAASARRARTASTTSRANVSGSGLSEGLSGDELGLDVEARCLARGLGERDSSSNVGMRSPSTGCWSGNWRAYLLVGLSRPTSKRLSSASVSVLMAGPGGVSHLPSAPRTIVGLSTGSCESTMTPSLVTARSVSSVVTPISRALAKAASVFSGASPRAPRWPCRSNALAGLRSQPTRMPSVAASLGQVAR